MKSSVVYPEGDQVVKFGISTREYLASQRVQSHKLFIKIYDMVFRVADWSFWASHHCNGKNKGNRRRTERQ